MCARQRSACAASARDSAIGTKAASVRYRNQPSQTLSPWPFSPTRFDAVVPVSGADQWEAVGTDAETAVDRRSTMVVEGSLPRRWFRLEVQVVLIGLE